MRTFQPTCHLLIPCQNDLEKEKADKQKALGEFQALPTKLGK